MELLTQFIKKEYDFTPDTFSANENGCFHIAYGTDTNYQMGAAISIASILENNKDSTSKYCIHIFTDVISSEYATRMQLISQQYDVCVLLYTVDERILETLPASTVWPLSIYYRLLAFDFLSKDIDTLLYLDSDIICKNNISELESLNLGDNFAAVVPDVDSTQKRNQQRLGIDFQGRYFNSGVILANLQQWEINDCSAEIFSLIERESDSGKLKYPDQDALNIIFLGRLVYLDRKYNAIFPLKSEFEKKDKRNYKKYIKDETVFIHYTGITKPWHVWAGYDSSIYFRRIYVLTPWKDEEYLRSKSIVEYREEYKHYLYQRCYMKALYALFLYRKEKFFK